MNDAARPPNIWVLADDRAGNRAQCLGVAEALTRDFGFSFAVKDIAYGPLARLPNAMLGASFAGLAAPSRQGLQAPWPDLVIAAGRRTAPVARAIRRRAGGRARLVQIMDPGAGAGEFALIVVPAHDRRAPAANIMEVAAAPHRVTAAALAEAADVWRDRLGDLASPRIALIVGGSTRRRTFTEAMARDLAARASALAAAKGGALMVSTSRRTGDAATAALRAGLTVPNRLFDWRAGGDNPYFGFLALADAVIVTGESMSMCSEACAQPGPVYVYAPDGLITAKHARLHQALFEGGHARPLAETPAWEDWSHPQLNTADEIAARVAELLRKDA